MVAVTDVRPPLLDEAIGISDRPYQREGIEFLWRRKRGMITDAPGLGKTPQGALASEPPVLVVCPTYLAGQWGAWLQEHFPHRKTAVARGQRWDRAKIIADESLDFLIVNKEMLRTFQDELLEVAPRFNTVIFDESHHLRNRTAEHSKGAAAIAKIIPRAYLLTATPIWKEVDDLYQQLHIMYPDIFNSYWSFVDTWCVADSDRYGTKVVGVKKSMLKELEEMLSQVKLGRTYLEAGRDLPPTIENVIKFDLSLRTRKVYDDLVNGYRLRIEGQPDMLMTSAMEVMHALRQVTMSEKIENIKDVVDDSRPYHQDRYVIFTWYKDHALDIMRELPGARLVTGDFTPDERADRAKSGAPIVATIQSLSEGVDLSHMRMVIFAEEHWPPGSNVQALARVKRERQTESNAEPILVYYIMADKTVDEDIHKITRRRSATIRELMTESLGLFA